MKALHHKALEQIENLVSEVLTETGKKNQTIRDLIDGNIPEDAKRNLKESTWESSKPISELLEWVTAIKQDLTNK